MAAYWMAKFEPYYGAIPKWGWNGFIRTKKYSGNCLKDEIFDTEFLE